MLGRTYEGQNCSVAKTLELIGERWTVLILREAFLGHRRFDEMAESLGIARNVLTARLQRLVEEGVLQRVAYQARPERFEYRLTDKGLDLWPVLVTLMQFGDRYYAPAGPPLVLTHRDCGGAVDPHRICAACGARLTARDVRAQAGPGAASPEAPARASALAQTGRR
jgi:DNA-binding HxlR family transcriptional regulator